MTVSYDDLIHRVRDQSGKFTLAEAKQAIESVFAVITDVMLEGDTMQIKGFGKLGGKLKKGHKGRNPQTGEPIDIPDRMIPYFEPSKKLKSEVAGT